MDKFGNTVHHIGAAQQLAAEIHQLRHRPAVPDEFENLRRDEGHGFRMIQSHAAREALLRQHAGLVEGELVELVRRQMHAITKSFRM